MVSPIVETLRLIGIQTRRRTRIRIPEFGWNGAPRPSHTYRAARRNEARLTPRQLREREAARGA